MLMKLARTSAIAGALSVALAPLAQAGTIHHALTPNLSEVAQSQATFDVASVKQVDISKLGDSISMNIGTVRGSRLIFENVTLNDCIRFAYGVASNSQIQGPDWIRSKGFLYDIDAQFPPNTTREELQKMMQALLADRFKLVVRPERKSISHLSLVAAGGGVKMESVRDVPLDFQGTTNGGRIDSILPMTLLANLLSRFETELPIIDETGLPGMYRVKLQWSLREVDRGADAEQGPSLFTALQEQLGLRLVHRKGPIDVVLVERADKVPTQN
jgi:uncharacterized protein (TIGR03435 family)